jgi:hypothetical protein
VAVVVVVVAVSLERSALLHSYTAEFAGKWQV